MSQELIEQYGSIEQAAFAQTSCLHENGFFHAEALVDELMKQRAELLEALKDMRNGWRYIRETHGDLYGVGWDRAEEKANAAIDNAEK